MPQPQDPAKTIAAQSAANKEAIIESAKVNSVNITGPFGRTYYRRNDDGTPAEQITELDPRSQQIYDTGLGISGSLADTAANRIQGIPQNKFSLAGMPYDPRNASTSNMPSFSFSSQPRGGAGGVGGQRMIGAGAMAPRPQSTGVPGGSGTMDGGAFRSFAGRDHGDGAPTFAPPVTSRSADGGQSSTGSQAISAGPMETQQFNSGDIMSSPFRSFAGMDHGDGAATFTPTGSPAKTDGQAATGGQASITAGPMESFFGNPAPSSRGQDSSVMPYDPRSYGDMSYFSNQVGDSIYNEGSKRLGKKFETDRRTLEQTLANRGLPMTGEAYRTAMEDQATSENDAYSSLANQATQAALAHTQGIVGLEQGLRGTAWNENLQGHQQGMSDYLQRLQVEANLRGQSINDMLMERNQDINEVSMLLGAGPQMGMPGAPNVPTYQVAAPNVQGAYDSAFNQQMAAYNAGNQRNAGMMSGLSSLGSAAMPFIFGSHPNFKEVIGDA